MATKKTIYIIRHGQTDYNLKGIIQGSGVDSDINEFGQKQADHFFRAYADMPFGKIFASELKRTYQTVRNFEQKGHDIVTLPELNEINWGKYEGIKFNPEVQQTYHEIVTSWTSGDLDVKPEGGESPNELASRQKVGIQKIMNMTGMDNILICSHGRAMRSLICVLLDIPLSRMEEFDHTNLCLYGFETTNGKDFELTIENETGHLNELNRHSA